MGLESLPFEDTQKSKSRQRIIFPPYQELQDDNFFILSFERRKPAKKKQRRPRRREKENPVFSEPVLEFEIRGGIGNAGEVLRPKIRANSVDLGYEAEADSENSSPSSVLEFVGFQEPSSSGLFDDCSHS